MKYEYDVAGRLVKEGDKVYSCIGLDKIESVTEGGRKLSSFTCRIDFDCVHHGGLFLHRKTACRRNGVCLPVPCLSRRSGQVQTCYPLV